jgi:hypothetical protein
MNKNLPWSNKGIFAKKEREMAYIRVLYKTKECAFDYVHNHFLNTMILEEEISHFYRPSEGRWISVKFDEVREGKEDFYQGPERRGSGYRLRLENQRRKNSSTVEEKTDWLERLWRHIEN